MPHSLAAFVAAAMNLVKQALHTRTLVIVSRHNKEHLPREVFHLTVSVRSQLAMFAFVVGTLFWTSYSTGRLIVAETQPEVATQENSMMNKIVELQKKVDELTTTNDAIVKSVSAKTSGTIDALEALIRQTGLSPQELKKQAAKTLSQKNAEGGPYIPAELSMLPHGSEQMLGELDELNILREIVGNLPLGRPIQNANVQSTFGNRIDPFNNALAFHAGVDMAAPKGASIYATADGKVITARRDNSYGNMVDIDHGFGIVTRYGHLSRITVKSGQEVEKGAIIGIQGSTGRSTGAHLHYEVRYRDRPVNPKKFLDTGHTLGS